MTADPSGRLIALRDHWREQSDVLRSVPHRHACADCVAMLREHADDLDGLITALLRPQREEKTEDTVSRVDGECDVPPTGSTANIANGDAPALRVERVELSPELRAQIRENLRIGALRRGGD